MTLTGPSRLISGCCLVVFDDRVHITPPDEPAGGICDRFRRSPLGRVESVLQLVSADPQKRRGFPPSCGVDDADIDRENQFQGGGEIEENSTEIVVEGSLRRTGRVFFSRNAGSASVASNRPAFLSIYGRSEKAGR